jgi:hypothetical protein
MCSQVIEPVLTLARITRKTEGTSEPTNTQEAIGKDQG